MRIAFIIHNQSGTGPYFKVLEQCSALVREGHSVTLFCTSAVRRWKPEIHERSGVTVFEAPDLLWGGLRQGADISRNAHCRYRYAIRQRFDIIHAVDCRPNVIIPALMLRRRLKIPLILSWWDMFGGGGLASERSGGVYAVTAGKLETFFEEYFRKYADGATVITSYLEQRLAAMGYPPEKIIIQRVGCDVSIPVISKEEARKRVPLDFVKPTFCFIGTMYQTDFAVLESALRLLRDKCDFQIIWIGTFEIDESVCQQYSIYRTGRLATMDEVYTHLAAADICLLPMKVNTTNKARWHSKISDYFLMQRPVVSTPISDFPEIFDKNDLGWLTTGDSPQELCDALKTAIDENSQWEEKGKCARRFVERELDVALIARQLTDFYKKFSK